MNNKPILTSDGYFSILDYHISHSRLLLRATIINEENDSWTNTDILFEGVRYIDVAWKFDTLTLFQKGELDIDFFVGKLPEFDIHSLKSGNFVLYEIVSNKNKSYFILAENYKISYNSLLSDESTL